MNATRVGDCCTGHDGCPPIPLKEGSENVFTNDRKAGRKGDHYHLHGCIIHSPHPDVIADGSRTVFINDIPAARIHDPVLLAGYVRDGSDNVFMGG